MNPLFMRLSFIVFCFFWLLVPVRGETHEYILISGGPALRYFEHGKEASHDKFWGNFIEAAVLRANQVKTVVQPGDRVTWLVYRPGYRERGVEMETDLLADIDARAKKAGINLMWFDNAGQIINYLNHGQDRKTVRIASFDYFGHSNKACFLFDYSNDVDGLSVDFLHVRELDKIHADIFARKAEAKSWGCHSGELFSQSWRAHFGIPMMGAIGKTDYSNGGLPFLSSKDGRWTE
jgi:hypothetical protein